MADAGWFAGRLRELREAAGLSRKELADKAGLQSEAGIRNLEQGVRRPTWETVLALARALGVSCEAFTREPAPRAVAGPGRPPRKDADAPAPEQPKRPRGRPPKQAAEQTTPPKTGRKPKGGKGGVDG
jgi:transcriptional regulator with XRE-family HTH domain